MASCPSRIHHQLVSFLVFNPRHHTLPNASAFICGTTLLPNDDVLPTADASTECFEENLLPNVILLPNSAHMSVSSLYQFGVNSRGGHVVAIPKWRKMEQELIAKGIISTVFRWHERSKNWYYAHGGRLNPDDGTLEFSPTL
jgi:hypothetical protein